MVHIRTQGCLDLKGSPKRSPIQGSVVCWVRSKVKTLLFLFFIRVCPANYLRKALCGLKWLVLYPVSLLKGQRMNTGIISILNLPHYLCPGLLYSVSCPGIFRVRTQATHSRHPPAFPCIITPRSKHVKDVIRETESASPY